MRRIDEQLDVDAVHDTVAPLAPRLIDEHVQVDVARRHHVAVLVRAGDEESDQVFAELLLDLLDDDLERPVVSVCHIRNTP